MKINKNIVAAALVGPLLLVPSKPKHALILLSARKLLLMVR